MQPMPTRLRRHPSQHRQSLRDLRRLQRSPDRRHLSRPGRSNDQRCSRKAQHRGEPPQEGNPPMKFKGTIAAAMSGKLGGIVASHNAGGTYFRALAIPTDPGSLQQEVIRAATSELANRWVNDLTAAQRDEWTAYAAAVPITDALGDPINIPPLAMYSRCNVPRIQTGLPRVDDAPAILDLGTFTPPTIDSIDATAETTDVGFEATDDWVGEDDSAMLIYTSRGLNPTINFFKGPYRYAASILGDGTTPPTSPATIANAFAVVAGQQVRYQIRVSRADGRLSSPFRAAGTAT